MRLVLLIVIGVTGYYLFGGTTMSPEAVAEYYALQMSGTLSRDPAALCNLLADDFEGVAATVIADTLTKSVVDKKPVCDSNQAFFEDIRKIGAAKGGLLRLGYHQDIGDVSFSEDRKSATVNVAYRLTVSGQLMVFDGTAVDTLIRRRGRVLLHRSNSTTHVETR